MSLLFKLLKRPVINIFLLNYGLILWRMQLQKNNVSGKKTFYERIYILNGDKFLYSKLQNKLDLCLFNNKNFSEEYIWNLSWNSKSDSIHSCFCPRDFVDTDQAIKSSIDSFNIFQRLQKIGSQKSSPAKMISNNPIKLNLKP